MKFCKTLTASFLAALLVFALAACESGEKVAATVNGEKIAEQTVTDRIMIIRNQTESYADDAAWATALKQASLTPETLREQIIESLKQDIIIRQAAVEKGITADQTSIDEQVAQARATIGGDDAAWEEALKKYGYQNEAGLRERLEIADLQTQLTEALASEPSEQALDAYLRESAGQFAGRRSSAIVLASSDQVSLEEQETKARELAAKLGAGEDFVTLVKEYSTDQISKDKDGDMGWSSLVQLSQGYLDALNALELDQISEPIVDGSNVYIIKCTGIFQLPTEEDAELDVSTIPEEIKEHLTAQFNQSDNSTKFTTFIQQMSDDAEVVINEMPADVPYNVDMSLAEDTDTNNPSEDASASAEPTMPPVDQSELTGSLVIVDIVEGEGPEAKEGDSLTVKYTGYFTDGVVFDSGEFTLTLGAGSVIKGWEQGLVGMKVGGQRHLVIPSDLAYGTTGSGSIPP
ncbi:MAG: FKBP-type peptidyl-prolyl cis-trans isomerase, partial [Coriobacteriales bacterium]|nr:FKBP-type peptidyl-prolyl cis-trans isomerase [Coriobacteriales bacterium]